MDSDVSSLIKELNEKETRILEEIYKAGGEIMLRDIWRVMGIKSKAGMPFINKLEKRGLLTKENIGSGKRVMYKVKLTELGLAVAKELVETGSLMKVLTYDLLTKIPCFYCPYIDVCGTTDEITPEKCEYLNKWIYEMIKERSEQ
ncbi:transcriptional regulator, MarR family [Vulcanisaeta moutnovskia 768-28]|uniref:Transcriptional regulator, MarR family n=1 Tax=Vulcanisaeta moutnovskia (strain 768-28) TaxID=985053 RepID=F0QU24_VULM7|nr:MarR family transcriptional regulator [Vulcanisaeta moutnovskia]ADY01810.1 transcriptional regulator, MarR family [Vulcanisaeta moutnovskia 768-28]